MAERHPHAVKALVLASRYYFPSDRSDVLSTTPAILALGDLIAHTVSPLLSRAMWPQFLGKVFGPERVPAKFGGFPVAMACRPSQIRASAADTVLMIPDAAEAYPRYGSIVTPAVIITGTGDGIVDHQAQAVRLHAVLRNSVLRRVEGAGHMIQQTAVEALLTTIDEASNLHLHGRAEVSDVEKGSRRRDVRARSRAQPIREAQSPLS